MHDDDDIKAAKMQAEELQRLIVQFEREYSENPGEGSRQLDEVFNAFLKKEIGEIRRDMDGFRKFVHCDMAQLNYHETLRFQKYAMVLHVLLMVNKSL